MFLVLPIMESPRMLLALLAVAAIVAPSSAAPPGFLRLPIDDERLYDRPVIGIVTHPNPAKRPGSYIAASYVKFVESAGARVIPLIYDDSWENIEEKLSLVNGVLFTGGSQKTGQYNETIKSIFQHVKERNHQGDPIPLLAICLGFEHITRIVSKEKLTKEFHAKNEPSTLQFPDRSLIKGSVFESFGSELIDAVENRPLAMQNHKYGVSPDTWGKNKKLTDFFNVLTTSENKTSQAYVSTIQAKRYPIIGTQWHPEKAIFEWGQESHAIDNTPHSEDAVRVAQHFANYFVSQARKSTRRPREDEVQRNLVDIYESKFGKWKSFDKVYIFPESSDA